MPDTPEDLWGAEFPESQEDSIPVTLLKQQAQALERRTKGRIVGVVTQAAEGETVWASLYARVPALQNYTQKILTIAHPVSADPTTPFPLEAVYSPDGAKETIENRAQLHDWLKAILSSEGVHRMIGNLLRYSRDRAAS
jgi:hypothetical protein